MISFDSATEAHTYSASNSHTVAHTVGTGNTKLLLVAAYAGTNNTTVSGITYNGVAMTYIGRSKYASNNSWIYLYYLKEPTEGTHNVIVSYNQNCYHGLIASSYFGVDQTSPINASGITEQTNASTITKSLIASIADCWAYGCIGMSNAGITSVSGALNTILGAAGDFVGAADSHGSIGAAGTYSLTFNGINFNSLVAILITPAPVSAPTVTTQAVSSIAQTTATGNGNVTDDVGATVTERGVCIGASANPTTAGTKFTAAAGGTGAFTAAITSLTASTHYHVRAYAINSEGTSYGADVEFDTLAIPYAISGIVSLTGAPVSGATVRCIRQSDNVALATQTTDGTGAYSFTALTVTETYHIAVEYNDGTLDYNALSLWDVVPYEVV